MKTWVPSWVRVALIPVSAARRHLLCGADPNQQGLSPTPGTASRTKPVNRLPVVDSDGLLEGVVSRGDSLKIFLRQDEGLLAYFRSEVLGPASPPSALFTTVKKGVVTLKGSPADRSMVTLLANAVRAVEGVVNVRMDLGQPHSLSGGDLDGPVHRMPSDPHSWDNIQWGRNRRIRQQGPQMGDTPTDTDTAVTRIFLLDDHEVVRRGIRDLLEAEQDLVVVGEASTADQALARGPALRPDVAVLDVRLPDGNGITVCRELRSRMPDLACLILTSFDDEDALLDAIMAGAAGYVLKQINGSDLVSAVRTVASGRSMLDPSTTARLMRSLREAEADSPPEDERLAVLSERERSVLDLIGEGLTNRQIAKRLYLSEKTVKNHISRLLGKLGVERRVQAAVIAAEVREHQQHER